ncbi:hypothetical protein SDC9_142531 [bioreactor metagenome]|uniref:Transcriptional regulator LacI/GalR-like sensor domain-containing protein n=1 Tax=bioreactor metagenome TaxID=1076179 RepID=A0A645E133_9ZZZZ
MRFVFSRHWEDRAILDAWESSDALLILPPAPLSEIPESLATRFRSRQKPVVFIGSPVTNLGFDCVCGSEGSAVNCAIDVLVAKGHRRIGYIGQAELHETQQKYLNSTFFTTWKGRMQAMHGNAWQELDLTVSCPLYQMPHQAMYHMIRKTLPQKKYTALIASISQIPAILAALTDSGIPFPEECSLIAIGDRMEVPFFRPEPSRILVPYETHARHAFDLARHLAEHPELPPQEWEVKQFYVEGSTVSINRAGE